LEEYLVKKNPKRVVLFFFVPGKFLTLDNFIKSNIILLNWCYLFKSSKESVDHLLFHCSVANELWTFVFSLFGVHWVMPKKVIDLYFGWKGKSGLVWIVAPLSLMWIRLRGRRERENQVFDCVELSALELKKLFVRSLYVWLLA